MPVWDPIVEATSNALILAAVIIVAGLVVGYLVRQISRRLLTRAGVPDIVEGTAFERTMRSFGTSTASLLASLSMWFVVGVAAIVALSVADVSFMQRLLEIVTSFLPTLFVAILVLIVGVVVGDKVELVVSERLRGIKLPEVGIIPRLAKYSIVYIAILIALGQIGVATAALLILLGAYTFGLVFIGGLALKDLLASGAAGMFLVLNQPYSIGDEIRVDGESGIVQEVDVFVTRIEREGEEYIIPNKRVLQHGVARVRHN